MCNIHPSQNLYKVLNVGTSADEAEIRRAYRIAALHTHPDKEGGSKEAFHAVAVAFEVLSCPSARTAYDSWLSQCFNSSQMPAAQKVKGSAEVHAGSKRSACHASCGEPPAKRRYSTSQRAATGKDLQITSPLDRALELVRSVLQSMNALQRQSAIVGMPLQTRTKLLVYMEHAQQAGNASCNASTGPRSTAGRQQPSKAKRNTNARSASTYGISKVYCGNGLRRTKYQASIHVKALRFYTREHSTIEAAIDHQIVLVQIKQALHARSTDEQQFWDEPGRALQACNAVLQLNGTSEGELGLRAWVHIRAPRWLGSNCRIGSTATNLASALEMHARLLRARATSWEALRAEWVQLVQVRRRISYQQAETIVDRHRHASLEEHLTRALVSVERTLLRARQKSRKTTTKRVNVTRTARGHLQKRDSVQII